jgi:hypothetical protein
MRPSQEFQRLATAFRREHLPRIESLLRQFAPELAVLMDLIDRDAFENHALNDRERMAVVLAVLNAHSTVSLSNAGSETGSIDTARN